MPRNLLPYKNNKFYLYINWLSKINGKTVTRNNLICDNIYQLIFYCLLHFFKSENVSFLTFFLYAIDWHSPGVFACADQLCWLPGGMTDCQSAPSVGLTTQLLQGTADLIYQALRFRGFYCSVGQLHNWALCKPSFEANSINSQKK